MRRTPGQARGAGFTLVEVVVAMLILAIFLLSMHGSRVDALVDATEARDWRLAREIAEEMLSELRAGAREMPPTSGHEIKLEKYPEWSYRFLIGEAAIADFEASMASENDATTGSTTGDRLAWQRQRDQMRTAQQKGLSLDQYQENQLKSTTEEKPPSEDEFEDVAIMVHFPISRASRAAEKIRDTFTLKAKVCTMAIQGLTPERAEAWAKANGKNATPTGPASPGSGSDGAGGTSAKGGG